MKKIITLVFGLILLAFYHPVFIAFGALLVIIVLLIVRFTSAQGMATSLEASDYKYKIAAWLQDMARNIKTFKYSKGTSLHLRKADDLTSDYLKARTNHFKILVTQYWSFISFKIIITAAMLVVGAVLLVDNQINIGQFIAADIVIISIINSVEKLIASLDKVYDTLTSVEKINTGNYLEIDHDLSEIEENIFNLSQNSISINNSFQHINSSINSVVKNFQEAYNQEQIIHGISTGFKSLDNLMGGLHRSDLIILAARPSMGKTALAMNIAYNSAIKKNSYRDKNNENYNIMRKDESIFMGILGTSFLLGWLGGSFGGKGILVGGVTGTVISYFVYENSH